MAAEINDESYDEESQLDYSASLSSDTQFYLTQINFSSVTLTLQNVNANKVTGQNIIPAKILKLSSDIIEWMKFIIFPIEGLFKDNSKKINTIIYTKLEILNIC